MSRPTKVPVMKQDQPFEDWRKELHIWELTNTSLKVEPNIQAGILFESLEGKQRQTVLSELSVKDIASDDGVQNIVKTLSFFYSGNETQNGFTAIDNLLNYKRPTNLSLDEFIVEFNLIINKVRASGAVLSESMLGYTLLNAANLSEDRRSMVRATCNEITYKTVKSQIEKVGIGSIAGNSSKYASDTKVKVEQVFHECNRSSEIHCCESSESSSEEDSNGDKVFYAGRNSRMDSFQSNRKPKMNPVDKFGHVRACAFCKCHYHWLAECPYAPSSVKSDLANKSRYKNVQKTL